MRIPCACFFALSTAGAAALLAQSCKESLVTSSGAALPAESAVDIFGGSSMADTILRVLDARLQGQASLSVSQARVVTGAALKTLTDESGALALSLAEGSTNPYLNDYPSFIGDLTTGAMTAFGDPSLGIDDREAINGLLTVIVGNAFVEMKGRLNGIDDEVFAAFIATLTRNTVTALASSGYSAQDIDEAMRSIMTSAVRKLGEADLLDESNGAAICSAVVQGAVLALPHVGLGDPSSAAQGVATDTPFKIFRFTAENINTFEPQTVFASFVPEEVRVDSAGAGADVYYAAILYHLMESIVPALKDAGFASEDLPYVFRHAIYTLIVSLANSGLDRYFILSVVDKAMFGVMQEIAKIGLSDAQVVIALGLIERGIIESLSATTTFDLLSKRVLVGMATFILTSRIGAVSEMTGASLQNAYIEVVARGTQALANADLGVDGDPALLATAIINTTLTAATNRSAAEPPARFAMDVLVKSVMAAAMAAGRHLTTGFPGKLAVAVEGSALFKTVVPADYDYDARFAEAEVGADFYADFADPPKDHYGAPKLADLSKFDVKAGSVTK
jgi:hypothetical protein